MKRHLALLLVIITVFGVWQPSSSLAQEHTDATLFVSDDGAYSVMLPDGWVAEGDREYGLVLGNYDYDDADIFAGLNVMITANAMSYEELSTATSISMDATLVEFLEALAGMWSLPMIEPITRTQARETMFLGRSIVTSVLTASDGEVMFVLYEIAPDTLNYVIIMGGPGMVNEQGKQTLEIVDTIRYSLPLDASYQDDDYEFPYPSDWYVEKAFLEIIYVANVTDVLARTDLESGEYSFAVVNPQNFDVDEDNIQDTVVEMAHGLWPENEALNPITISVDGQEIAYADVQDFGTTTNVGGIMVKAIDEEFVAVFHIASVGEAEGLWLTALNILLNIE